VCLLVYARTHTQTTCVLDISPGKGQTPGDPEEPRRENWSHGHRDRIEFKMF